MKTLKCKNCGQIREYLPHYLEARYEGKETVYLVGCPNCRENVMYSKQELDAHVVDEPVVNDVEDTVNHPSHYNKYEREVIDSIRGLCTADEYRGYLKGNQIKYLARYQDKNGLEDLRKHRWYVDALIEFEEGRE